jgi:hypothetical protein
MVRIRERAEQLAVEGVAAILDGSALDAPEVSALPLALSAIFRDLLDDQERWANWEPEDAIPVASERLDESTLVLAGIVTTMEQWSQPFRTILKLDSLRSRLVAVEIWLGDAAYPIDSVPYVGKRPRHWPQVEVWRYHVRHPERRQARRERTRRWRDLLDLVSAGLYEWDPEAIGARAGSPRDEYESVATQVISALNAARTRAAFDHAAMEFYPTVPPEMLDQWWVAFVEYWRS